MTANSLPLYSLEDLESVDPVVVDHFSKEDAYELGVVAAQLIQERALNLAVDIVIGDDLVFRAKFAQTNKGNDAWLAGKAAVTRLYGVPSLLVRLRQEATGVPFTDLDLDHELLKAHGGSIPIFVNDDLVATITMSGEPDVVDHQTCSAAIERYLAGK